MNHRRPIAPIGFGAAYPWSEFLDDSFRAGHHFFSGGCTALDLIRFKAFCAEVLTLWIARRSAPSSGERVVSRESCLSKSSEYLCACGATPFSGPCPFQVLLKILLANRDSQPSSAEPACMLVFRPAASVPLFSFAHAGVQACHKAPRSAMNCGLSDRRYIQRSQACGTGS